MERAVKRASKSLTPVFGRLDAHSSHLRAVWRKALRVHEPCRHFAAVLSTLHPPARLRELESGNPLAHREESERIGMELARRGLPARCLSAAGSPIVGS